MFIVNTDDEVDGKNDAGVALWRAFNYITEEHGVSQAFISIVHVSWCTTYNFFRLYSGFCITVIITIYYFNISKFIKTIMGTSTHDDPAEVHNIVPIL